MISSMSLVTTRKRILAVYEISSSEASHDKCSKYHFVDKWVQSLEGGMYRNYYIFMFQENGLKNGGLGDRLGGLLTHWHSLADEQNTFD